MTGQTSTRIGRNDPTTRPEPSLSGAGRGERARLLWRWVANGAYHHTMSGVLAAGVVMLAIASPAFRDTDNLVNILRQNAIIGVVACGMCLMIIVGGFDLSVGAVAAAAGVVAGVLS